MNFLAHCALAADAATHWQADEEERVGLIAGAVIGDFIKGRVATAMPRALQAGVRVHRRIDALSNADDALTRLADLYPTDLRRYAPIFVDLLIDHALARRWHDFYEIDLKQFSALCYAAIAEHASHLPERGQRFFAYMQEVDLIASYAEVDHLDDGLTSVLRRLQRTSLNERVLASTLGAVSEAEQALPSTYPQYQTHWTRWSSASGFLGSFA